MTDRQTIEAGAIEDAAPLIITTARAPVTAAWTAEQSQKQAIYSAKRAAWQMMLERRAEGTEAPSVVVCRCRQCGRRLRLGRQLRLPF